MSKPADPGSNTVVSGHRYYAPREGRFISRVPIEESGGLSLYGFVLNDPVNRWDYLGMEPAAYPPEPQFTAGDYDDWLDEEYADWLQEMRHLERAWEREVERAVMADSDDAQFSNPGMGYSVYVNGEFQGTVSSLGATSYQLAEHVLNNSPSEVAGASSTGQTPANATAPNGDAPTAFNYRLDAAPSVLIGANLGALASGQQSSLFASAELVDPTMGMIGQSNPFDCVVTAAYNGAVLLGGTSIISSADVARYNELSDAALGSKGTDLSTAELAFNDFVSGTSHRATSFESDDLYTMTNDLVNSADSFISSTMSADRSFHAQLYVPDPGTGEVDVYSSGRLNGEPTIRHWRQDPTDTWSDIKKSQKGPRYKVIIIK